MGSSLAVFCFVEHNTAHCTICYLGLEKARFQESLHSKRDLLLVFAYAFVSNDHISNREKAPAQSAVEYETVVFTGGLKGDTSQYLGSSSEVDAAWDTLYNGMFQYLRIIFRGKQ